MPGARAARPEAILLGSGMIVASVFMLSFGDALVKWASAEIPLLQIFVVRSLLAIPLCLLVLRLLGQPVALTPGTAGWVFLRSLLLVMMWMMFYLALPQLELSVAAAALYTGPLFIALFSAVLIGEPVGLRRACAIFVGFAGVLIVIRPGSEVFSYATLLPILAAAFYAFAMIITRSKCAEENPFVLALCLSVLLLLAGAVGSGGIALLDLDTRSIAANPFLLSPWASMTDRDWGLIAVMAVLLLVASAAAAKAYQSAPPVIVATFDYSYLLFAVFWGLLFFAEVPDGVTLTGIVLIAGAGLMVIRQPSRAKTAVSPALSD